jgi:pyruvate formate lyase activating enzyme
MRFFSSKDEGTIQCSLCPRRCLIAPDKTGLCKVRINSGGKPALPFYGFITALALDPIEKKPLYHFRPGSEILSIGFAGCNLHCPFCQNWHISQNTDAPGRVYSPSELIAAVKKSSQDAAMTAMRSIAAMLCAAASWLFFPTAAMSSEGE